MKQVGAVLSIRRFTRTMALVFQPPGIVLGSLPPASHLMFTATFLGRCYCHHHYTDEATEARVGAELPEVTWPGEGRDVSGMQADWEEPTRVTTSSSVSKVTESLDVQVNVCMKTSTPAFPGHLL